MTIDELIALDKKDELAVTAEEGEILRNLIKDIDPKLILEVGTGHGYSTLWMYNGLGPDGFIYTIDKERREHLFTGTDRIKFLEGKLSELINDIPEKLDVVFLDTDHLIYKVVPDIDLVTPKLKVGSVVVIHDTNYRTVLGRCLVDYFKGEETDLLKEEKTEPSKLKWDYRELKTEFGLGIATLNER